MPNVAGKVVGSALKSALNCAGLAACLLGAGAGFAQDHAFAWNPRSGDAWIDRQLTDINVYGGRYRGAFIDEVVRYHAAPRELVSELVMQRNWAPGDVYYACAVAQVVGRPCRAVVDAWSTAHADGWEAVARQAGIANRPDAVARLKQDITASYARWGRPIAEVAKKATPPASPAHARKSTKIGSKRPAKSGG